MTRIRLGGRGCLVIVALIGGTIYFGIQTVINNMAGCSDSLLSRFKQTSIAAEYKNAYIAYLQQKDSSFIYRSFGWSINKQGDGCLIEGKAYGNRNLKSTTYTGDKFFKNLVDKKVYPQSEGAKLLLDRFGGSVNLP